MPPVKEEMVRPGGETTAASSEPLRVSELQAADIACLKAAKAIGLLRRMGVSDICPGSVHPNFGWWARANWDNSRPDTTKGGPWSMERVHALCERGLMGIDVDGKFATLTRDGKVVLKAALADGASRQVPAADAATRSNAERRDDL